MKIAIKLFATYAGLSMLCGMCLMVADTGGFLSFTVPNQLITALWMGPILLTTALGVVGGLVVLWRG